MSSQTFFSDLAATQQLLQDHGFDRSPDDADFLFYLFDLNDKVDAICASLQLEARKDVRGRWSVYASKEVG